jgi:alpha,alpha-trehalase
MSVRVAAEGPILSGWSLVWEGFDPVEESLREVLCTLGNGRFATRGCAPEAAADGVHYPGTYAAGVYNLLTSEVAGRQVADESMVNLPNWQPLTFRIEDDEWFDLAAVTLGEYRQELDLGRGLLTRKMRFGDADGRETELTDRRFVSMADPHIGAIQTILVPLNWSGDVTFRAALDGQVTNGGVARYQGLANRHLVPCATGVLDPETISLAVETSQSHIRVAQAARLRLLRSGQVAKPATKVSEESGWIGLDARLEAIQGEAITAEKVVAMYTSREPAVSEPLLEARQDVAQSAGFEVLLSDHVLYWDELWDLCRLEIEDGGEPVAANVRLHLYHLLTNISGHSIETDAGVPARGLTGEAYRGHVFWDALFVFPFLNLRLPNLTRSLLRYRYERLSAARRGAAQEGFEGALYPWQSGSSGVELTPTVHLNPRSGRWTPDNSRLQRHINSAVAYDVWQYHQATNDIEFLAFNSAEMFLEIARFWASIATLDPQRERFVIRGVVGPDEYHDAYPGSDRPGIDNNAYTNAMAAWVLWKAQVVLDTLPEQRRNELSHTLRLEPEEVERWDEISRRLLIPFLGDGIISQFEGYEELEELDWEAYRGKYGNIERLDRILEAEGDTPNRYKASKQADVLMLFYLLSGEELGELFERLGYLFDEDEIPRNIEYYLARTSHGSTLSKVVHAWVLARSDAERAWRFFSEALESDLFDTQGGTTPEGIHLGAMAGTLDLIQRAFGGVATRDEVLWLRPNLPSELSELRFRIRYRRHWGLEVDISHERVKVSARPADLYPIELGIDGEIVELEAGATIERSL